MALRLTILSAALLGLLTRAAPPPIEIPFSFQTKQPIVQVSVNGTAALPFVVDTGASINVVEASLVDTFQKGARITAARPLSGGGEGTVPAQTVDGLTLAMGATQWTGQRAVAVSLGYPKTKHFAGLIGAPILNKYVVQFDFVRNLMRLLDPASYQPPAGSVQLPFELQDELPIVHVTIDAGRGPIDARLMVDTGASQFVDLNRPFVDAHGLVELMSDAAAGTRPAAIGTPAPFLNGKARVVFGGRTFVDARVGLSRAASGSSSRAERDGILGNDLLRHFIVTIDYRRRLLVLEPAIAQEVEHQRIDDSRLTGAHLMT